jgi:hypothetical protein
MEPRNPLAVAGAAAVPQPALGSATGNLPCGYVYFLWMNDPSDSRHDFVLVKIGITKDDISRRIATLQTGNPFDLICFGCLKTPWPSDVEHFMHRSHAPDMQKNEWLRWRRDSLQRLVEEAKDEARRIEERKGRVRACIALISNGYEHPATPEVVHLHREAQELKKKLTPEQLRLDIAANCLRAATGATLGIRGIVQVRDVAATIRFSAKRAELQLPRLASQFPDLAAQCRVETIGGNRFRWRGVKREPDFPDEYQAKLSAEEAATASREEVLTSNVRLQGRWTNRTPDLERWHDDFLRATQTVHQLGAKLADLQTELTVLLADYDAFIGVCSFKRRSVPKFQRSVFCRNFPEESTRCAEPVPRQIRKYVYPSRSYLQIDMK